MNHIEIHTDGACKGNPGPGGWGVLLKSGHTEKELFGGELATTNNRMELTAVIEALAAPLAGRLADRRGPELVTRLGAGLAAVSFAAMGLAPMLAPQAQLVLLIASAIGFDFGIQASLVAHQTLVYGLEPGARSRLNALFITGMFIGMAAGAALGILVLSKWGWPGIVALTATASLGALAVRLLRGKERA